MNSYIDNISPGINTVIFDLGNVLLSYDWPGYLKSFGFDGRTYEIIANAIFRNEDWEKGDEGVVTPSEWVELFVENAPEYEMDIRKVFAGIRQTIDQFPYTEALVFRLLEQGYRLYFLSNYSKLLYEQTKTHMGFLEKFDGGIFSYREKLIKPDAKIFRLLLERYHLNPSEAVFFDDLKANVEAAETLSIYGAVFTQDVAGKLLSGI